MKVSQLAFIPDPSAGVKISSGGFLPGPAARGMCNKDLFNRDLCGEKKQEGEGEVPPEGVKQGVTISPNISERVR